jgi:superoxide dismutase, Fe-Mn family
MELQIRPLPFDPMRLSGLSERLLASHHRNNYGGAVRRLNAIRQQLATLDWSTAPGFVVNGLKREELIAANSMWLHELYFAGLGGNGELAPGGLSVALARDFGSVERWRAQFVALGRAMGGGSGWALLAWSAREARLLNHWAADHTHVPAGCTPLLALDMYEHAYHLDHGSNAVAYVDAFMGNIDWLAIGERYVAALEADAHAWRLSADELTAQRASYEVLDVRRDAPFKAAPDMIEGATWADPQHAHAWADEWPAGRKVVVYCVYGHEVCQSTAAVLRARGIDAHYLEGGIAQWKEEGRPVQPKGETS